MSLTPELERGVALIYSLSVLIISVYKCGKSVVESAACQYLLILRLQILPTSFYRNRDFKDDRFQGTKMNCSALYKSMLYWLATF